MWVEALFDKVHTSQDIQQKVNSIGSTNYEKLASLASELGFILSEKDFETYFKELLSDGSDLNDDELNSLSGGTWGEVSVEMQSNIPEADSGW